MYTAGTQAKPQTRILVVRLSAMGDVIHALPAVATLKHSFPGSHLTWIVAPQWAPLLEGNAFVDRVVMLDRRSPGGLLRAWRELRAFHYDFAVDFQGLIKSALAASAARPDRLYGFHLSLLKEKLAGLFYSTRAMSQSAHVVDRCLDLAAAAGAGSIVRAFPIPEGTPGAAEPEGNFVLACPLAGWRGKQWPMACYGELAGRLQEWGLRLVISGPSEAALQLARIPDALVRPTGIAGLIALTRQAAAVVGIDSGPLHLAAALGKPGVAVYGPTDPARNGPYGGSIAVLRSPSARTTYKRSATIDASMREITPKAVMEALGERLGGARFAGSCAT